MSVSQYPDSIGAPEVQIWNNLAFDNAETEEPAKAVKASWSLMQFVNTSDSIESSLSKENLSPNRVQSQSSVPVKPQIGKPLKLVTKKLVKEELGARDERRIDSEIEEIEKEISRLSSKLEALRMERIVKTTVERRGRVVPAKFMDQRSNVKNSEPQSKPKRRGVSVGPAEIAGRQMGKPEMTPVQPIQNRRKSCFWKLQEIDEKKVQASRQAATTSRKVSKKEDSVVAAIQPKKLFRDSDKSVTAKKPAKTGRVVPSRYNSSVVSERKRSLPQDDGNEEAKRSDKRIASSLVGKSWGSEVRVKKKKWEIPNHGDNVVAVSTPCVVKVVEVLPRIRTNRFVNETPRSSGAAKRVAEMSGRRSVFSVEELEESVCQVLSFGDDAEQE